MQLWRNIKDYWQNDLTQAEREEVRKDAILAAEILVVGLLLVWLFSACKTKTVVVTEYRDRVQHDTILHVDSITDTRYVYIKGDTVHDEREVVKYKILHEKEYVHLTDSIPYPVEVIREVKAPLNGWQHFIQGSGYTFWALFILGIIALAIYIIIKIKKPL